MKCTALRPLLETRDMAGTVQFYTTILGFQLLGSANQDGDMAWCHLQRDDAGISFSLPNTVMNYPAVMLSGSLYINVEEVDGFWESLKDKCEVVYSLENFDYGMREFAIKDNNGYVINFGEEII